MAQHFPKWTNYLPHVAVALKGLVVAAVIGFFWYYGSPKYTDVGYRPKQPIPYSHKLHAGDLGLDCRYCHSAVESSKHANVPPTQTCMNCHKVVKTESEKLAPLRASWESGVPVEWVRVHKTPEYAYFNHAPHLRAGVGCVSCHGRIDQMEEVAQAQPLSMGWCLDCHRNPTQALRPDSVRITDMTWIPGPDQAKVAEDLIIKRNLNPPEDCSACHR